MSRLSIASLASALVFAAGPALAQGQAAALPAGEGQPLVEAMCKACHDTNLIVRSSGYSRDGWRELVGTMMDLSGTPELGTITNYLATHFPETTKRAPRLVSGDVAITFREWTAPTLGQRSRDPAQAPDGSIWWAAQWANLIGRIDPATGAMKEYPLPDGAMPHTVLADRDGNIWYTGNRNATVGRLDPNTGEVTDYKMPNPAAKDPHSAIFDRNGILWFTLQISNMVGRLDPARGDVRLVTMPTLRSRPYGIKVDAAGAPWVACNGSNCVVRVDPDTMALREYKLPEPKTTVRRLAIADDGTIWYVNSSQGRLGRLNPQTGETKEWASPSGPGSHPYAIAIVDGIVWYNESGQRPDALVRFDPATETFQSWAIPSGGVHAGIVRHMRPTRDGNLLIHQSSTNRIIEVTLKRPASAP